MKRLILAIAAAATTLFAPAAITQQLDFESDGTAYESDARPSATANYPFANFGSKYLELDDEYTPDCNGGTIFDMYVQFTVREDPSLGENDKLGICLNSNGNLIVLGEGEDELSPESQIAENTWHRLTLVQVQVQESGKYGFNIYLDGNQLIGAVDKAVFYAKVNAASTSVKFEGSGKLDNFVARTTDPFVTRTTEVVGIGDFATGGEYFTEVSNEAIAAAAAAGLPLTLYGNAALTATLNAGDSFTLIKGGYELTGLGDKYTVNGNTYTRVSAWSDYLGDAVAGAYEIDDLTELKAFQANVGTLPTANLTFKLTADIALDAAWEGIGVKAGKDLVNGDNKDIPAYEAGAFSGTFNGQGHTISSFQMENGTDYGGFFNSVNGATIENLNVSYKENKLCANSSATGGDTGATFVGVARNSTLQNLTALATEDVDTVSASKDMAGIVAYLMAGSTVDSCTNELNVASLLTGKPRKSGGIALITQEGTGTATIRNCKNSGTVTLANASGQAGGIVGYVGQSTTIENCENTAAVKMLTHMGNTVTLQGVNKGNATVASYTGNATPGLNFATVNGDVATFVADDALVLDGSVEYKVMGPSAAYTFAAAGTLALDQSLAAATVTADTSTLVLSDETVDNVTTYTAVAGVASVNAVAYATFEEAVAAIGETGDDFVTLLADVTTDLNAGTTLKVRTNAHELTFNKAADVLVTTTADGSTGITTYTSVEGMAKCNDTWYATFNEAYSAALSSSGNATMEVKLTSDFTPDISATYDHFYSLTFTDVRDDKTEGLTINLKNAAGTAYMKSSRYFFPSDATLNLAADYDCWTNGLISGGTLNIPEGVTVSIGAYLALNNLTSIIGEGRIKPSAAACYYLLYYSNDKLPTSLRETTWKGTLEISGTYTDNFNLNNYGNSDSTIAFNAYTGYVHSVSRIADVGSIEVLGGGLTVNGDYSSGTYTFPNTVKGSGPLTVHVVNSASGTAQKTVKFTGDASAFAGDLKIVEGSNCRVAFGSEGLVGDGSCIVVCSDAEVSVAEGKTWDSQNGFVVLGTLNVAGTLKHQGASAANQIYGSATTGKIVYKNAAAITTFGGSYAGEIVIDSIEAGDTATQVALGFGCSDAKLTLNGVSGNAWCAGADYTVQPEVTLAGNVHFQNGSSGKTVTFRKIAAGTGNLSLRDWNGCSGITYGFTTLDADNYTGTVVLYGSKLTFKVGNILKAGAVAGDKVLPLTVESNATVDLSNATLNGETADLELKADGIYVAAPAVPKVAEVVNGEQYETLAEAIAAAEASDTVRLLANATLDTKVTISKNLVLDLNGYTLGNEGDTKVIFSIINGATLTVNGSLQTYCYGRFNIGAKNDSGNLVLNNGYYMVGNGQTVIHVNGLCTASSVTVTGAIIYSANDNGVQFSGTGTYVLNNAMVVGATAVYMKAGTLQLKGTTQLNATGDKKAVSDNNNGSDATGDALVLDSCTPPYAAITGVTVDATVRFASTNGSGVLAYAREGNTRVTKILPKNVTITEKVATESDLFVGGSIDPTSETKTTEVDAISAQAAIEAVTVDVPKSISANTGVTAAQYKSYFKYVATPVEGNDGVYEVELVGLADEVKADADIDAMDVLNGDATAITLKPGLYYGVSAVTSLTDAGIAAPQQTELGGLHGATKLDVSKPGTTQGFIKVWISTQPIQ